jgi:hypothetical protein
MAIINCPNCDKKTTELSSRCPHCGFDRSGEDYERHKEMTRRKLRDHVYHLKMTSYAVITFFLAAFGWYWWDTSGFQHQSSFGPILLLSLGTLAYLVIRVLMFRARRQLIKLNRCNTY